MGQRPGFLVTVRELSPKAPWTNNEVPDPRSQVPEITVEIRAHWPNWADVQTVARALDEAIEQAHAHLGGDHA